MNTAAREKELDAYDFSFVHEALANENKLIGEDLAQIEQEFKRFMKLVLSEEGPLAMIDRRVDEFWHTLILFTPQYQGFCESVMGFFVHHQPRDLENPCARRCDQKLPGYLRKAIQKAQSVLAPAHRSASQGGYHGWSSPEISNISMVRMDRSSRQ